MACRNLAFSALQHAPIHRRSKPNGAIEGPSKIILSSKMGGCSYFGRGPRPPFCPPQRGYSKKNLSRNLGGKKKSRSKNLEKTSNILIQQINSNQLESFLVYWAAYFTLKNGRLFPVSQKNQICSRR